eukprot:1741678-Lingulodinium_polyedra.AAC.1
MSACCGIFRFLATLRTICYKNQLPVAIEGLRSISKLDLHKVYHHQWSVLTPWPGQAVLAYYAATKATHDPQAEFLNLNKNLIT